MSAKRKYIKYVTFNMLSMIGISLYVLADTFFIAQSSGADGITALNLVLPVYSILYAIGAMIGIGSAIRFSINKNMEKSDNGDYFMNAVEWSALIGLVFSLAGIVFPGQIMKFMGADAHIVAIGRTYTRIFMAFSPFFILSYVFGAFVRNDGSPHIAMASTLFSSFFNIVFDYILIFPVGMGMNGAALATALSPIVAIAINCIHFKLNTNTLILKPIPPSLKKLFFCIKVGVSAFVSEISSGVITAVFNVLMIGLAGNMGVAAYGIVANIALVPSAMYNGITLGIQPLISEYYGLGKKSEVKKIRNWGFATALILGIIIVAGVYLFTETIAGLFNKDNDIELAKMAYTGLRLYILGFILSGVNVVCGGYFSSVNNPGWAFVQSVVRGFIAVTVCAFLLSRMLGITGVWIAFPVAELITFIISVTGCIRMGKTNYC